MLLLCFKYKAFFLDFQFSPFQSREGRALWDLDFSQLTPQKAELYLSLILKVRVD